MHFRRFSAYSFYRIYFWVLALNSLSSRCSYCLKRDSYSYFFIINSYYRCCFYLLLYSFNYLFDFFYIPS
jgi:hypothetical protein